MVIVSLQSQGRVRKFKKEDIVYTPLDKCVSVGFILQGSFRMTKFFSSGRELVIQCLPPGEMFGELICFTSNNYPCWIVSSDNSAIFELPIESLFRLIKDRTFLFAFMSDIAKKSLHLNNKIEILSLKKVNQKIAYFILSQIENINTSSLTLNMSISELAVHLGSSREAVSRSFSELESRGYITKQINQINIIDIKELENELDIT